MFRLRLKVLMERGQRDIAEAYLEGAWRAIPAVLSQRDAAIMILRDIDRDQWELIPKGMLTFILEDFNERYNDIVPGDDPKPADV